MQTLKVSMFWKCQNGLKNLNKILNTVGFTMQLKINRKKMFQAKDGDFFIRKMSKEF